LFSFFLLTNVSSMDSFLRTRANQITPDQSILITNKDTGLCMKFNGANKGVVEATCDASATEQQWVISKYDDGNFKITSKVGNYNLDNGKDDEYVTPVANDAEVNCRNQKWIVDTNAGTIKSVSSSLCVDNTKYSQNNVVGQTGCNGKDNQVWLFKPVVVAPPPPPPAPVSQPVNIRGYLKDPLTINLTILDQLTNVNIVFTNANGDTFRATYTSGIYDVTLPPGTYKRSTVVSGYADDTFTVTIVNASNESDGANTIYLVAYYDGWKVILYWNKVIQDLDLWCKVMATGHIVFYNHRSRLQGAVSLDVDAQHGLGPETISVKSSNQGLFEFVVSNFSKEQGQSLAAAEAKIKVYKFGKFVGEFFVPSAPADALFWRVFTLNTADDSLTPINQVVSTYDTPIA